MEKISLLGKRFGLWTVIEEEGARIKYKGHSEIRWKCRCDCGTISILHGGNLRSGNTSSCGCKMAENTRSRYASSRAEDIGKKFNRLTVLRESGIKHGQVMYECLCDCGKEKQIKRYAVVHGVTKSCGCLTRESTSEANRRRGGRNSHRWLGGIQIHGSLAHCRARIRSIRATSLRRGFVPPDITAEDLVEAIAKHNGSCDICSAGGTPLHLDHNHKTGAFRGLICYRCNSTLGLCLDSIDILKKMMDYLSA
jgi:hypothetical protein